MPWNGMEWNGKTFSGNKMINVLISEYRPTLAPNCHIETVIAQLESTECCSIVVLKQAIPGVSFNTETRQLQRRAEMKRKQFQIIRLTLKFGMQL
jgi:hypothetical protein